MANSSRTLRRLLIVALFVILSSSFSAAYPGNAQQGTEVGAILCSTESPDLQIIQPISDSVTDSPTVQIEGVAQYTSQIDVIVNGQYSHTVAIGFDTILQTQASLQEGTNTITLQAYFSCNGTSNEVDIILDYQPAISPASPGNVITQVGSPGVQTTSQVSTNGLGSTATQIVEDVKHKLGLGSAADDFDETADQSYVSMAFNWLLFLTTLTFMAAVFAPSFMVEKVVSLLRLKTVARVKHPHRFTRFLIAFIAILLATFLAMT